VSKQVAEQIYDNALIAAGLLEDPQAMLKRINSLLEQVVTK
jgi:TNF receptor-associated protein 1